MEKVFKIDKQTYQDLQIFGEHQRSVFSCFDSTVTAGGKEALQYLFYTPSSDLKVIQSRQDAIRACLQSNASFPFEHSLIQDLSQYWRSAFFDADRKSKFWSILSFWQIYSAEFYYKKRYILDTLALLRQLEDFLVILNSQKISIPEFHTMQEIVAHCLGVMTGSEYKSNKAKVTLANIHLYDEHIRLHLAEEFKTILEFIYQLDAYIAIAATAKSRQLTFPEIYLPTSQDQMRIDNLHHIFQQGAVTNDIVFERKSNLWYLTGANMAGKSTLIKALSIAIYLTHIGLPVPATAMHMPVLDGLFTTINLPDNLEAGYSHFYHEAIRLRDIIGQLETNSNSFIVLDELFTGTNYQDAYASTKEVVDGLTKLYRPFIIISSHLTELSAEIKSYPNLRLCCMKTDLDKNNIPKFTYRLADGVANEKLGLWLLGRSGLLESVADLIAKYNK